MASGLDVIRANLQLGDAPLVVDYNPFRISEARCGVRWRSIRHFDVLGEWICDTGCPADLIDIRAASRRKSLRREGGPIKFATVGGEANGSDVLPISVGEFENVVADPVILKNTPPVISAGPRILNGAQFHLDSRRKALRSLARSDSYSSGCYPGFCQLPAGTLAKFEP